MKKWLIGKILNHGIAWAVGWLKAKGYLLDTEAAQAEAAMLVLADIAEAVADRPHPVWYPAPPPRVEMPAVSLGEDVSANDLNKWSADINDQNKKR